MSKRKKNIPIIFKELAGNVQVEFLKDGKYATLLRDYSICITINGRLRKITVPLGFLTDFASVPKILRNIFPIIGKGITEASVIHDWLYQNLVGLTRQQIDEIFFNIMRALGTSKFKSRCMYWGVRGGGWVTWNKYRKEGKNNGIGN